MDDVRVPLAPGSRKSSPDGLAPSDFDPSRFYIDCEFDGHGGQLLSIALVKEDGRSIHIRTKATALDPWVKANVVPIMGRHQATLNWTVEVNDVGTVIREFIGGCQHPVIIADSPVDIGRFCTAISTSPQGGWASAEYPLMTFEVHNVDCYPTALSRAVQHNAWWDAMALREKLRDSDDIDLALADMMTIPERDFKAALAALESEEREHLNGYADQLDQALINMHCEMHDSIDLAGEFVEGLVAAIRAGGE